MPHQDSAPSRLLAIALALLATACVTKGEVQIGRPHVYDSETTQAEIKKAGKRIATAVRKGKVDTVQESFGVRELISVRGSVATAGAGAAGATPGAAPAPPAPMTDITPGLPAAPATEGFGKTLPELVNDLAHRERQAIELDLLYSGAADPDLMAPNARIYLARFDMGIFPHRQSYLMYPLLWIRSVFGTTYNFTKGWFAQTSFWMPSGSDPSNPLLFVYDIDPRYSVITANETLANLLSTQLTATGGTPAVQAQVEYLRQLEEQFAQQRRYPLQMGMIDGTGSFSWTYGPRRRVEKRSALWRLNPFASKYKVVSRLEPGMRTGHVLIVVPDIAKLRAELAALSEEEIGESLRLFAESKQHRHYKSEVARRVDDLAKEVVDRLKTEPAAQAAAAHKAARAAKKAAVEGDWKAAKHQAAAARSAAEAAAAYEGDWNAAANQAEASARDLAAKAEGAEIARKCCADDAKERAADALSAADKLLEKAAAAEKAATEAAAAAASTAPFIELPMVAQGNFIMLDRPYVRHPLPVRNVEEGSCCDPIGLKRGNREAQESLEVVYLKLPKGPPWIESPVAITIGDKAYKELDDKLGRLILTMPEKLEEAPRKVSLYADEVGPGPLTVRSHRLLAGKKDKIGVVFVRPTKPTGAAGKTVDLTLAVSIETREKQYVANTEIQLVGVAWGKGAPKKPGLSESFGGPGEVVTIALGERLIAEDVSQVLFGNSTIRKAAGETAGWWVADADGKTIELVVPEPPKGARAVRVVLQLSTKGKSKNKDLEYLSVGSFSYASSLAH